jgi:NTP pyrophosphatase (non-canonical NTP hydrolase)
MKITDLDLYQELAMRTSKKFEDKQKQLEYSILSLNGEAGELANLFKKKVYHNKPGIDTESFVDEASDILWYLACFADSLGITLSDIATYNIQKLEKRYNEGMYNEKHYTSKEQ